MCTCEYMYVYKEVLSVSTRKVTHICRFAQHRFVYKWIYDMIYVHFWKCRCIQKGSKCEHSQGHKHMWVCTAWVYVIYLCVLQSVHWQGRDICDFAQLEFIYKSICHTLYVYLWMNVYIYIYKEVLSVRVREGRDICEFAQHRFIYKSSDDIIHVYLWIYVFIQEVLSVSVYEGRSICGIWNVA